MYLHYVSWLPIVFSFKNLFSFSFVKEIWCACFQGEKKVFWWISSISKVAIILVNSISWFPNYIVVTFCLVKHESQNVVATRPDIIDIIELNFNLKEDIKMWSKITSFKHFILILKEIYCPLHWCFCIIKEETVHTFILALSSPFVCVLYCIS